jgi:hypothetical protein
MTRKQSGGVLLPGLRISVVSSASPMHKNEPDALHSKNRDGRGVDLQISPTFLDGSPMLDRSPGSHA